ncbi:MAG: hypothetical protein HRT67_04905 [Flavobacteriaceae bacterium]|nr:hypothetical protein [Flavobacteriaceae bacterium]
MSSFEIIQNKLEEFITKYYINALIKGIILFIAIGLLYFLFTLFIEHMLWLEPWGRTLLFWMFVSVELGLFVRFIIFPLARLFKLKKGLNYQEASEIIGDHFPEVSDKLLNVLQLNSHAKPSELLLASIEQKSTNLKPVPFKLAIRLSHNTKYLKYLAIPILIILMSYATGKMNWFNDSYQRMVNYQMAYEPPAPFQFFINNNILQAIENTAFTLMIRTEGDVIPEDVQIVFNEETYYLENLSPGLFKYTFTEPKHDIDFRLLSNNVSSKLYTLEVVQTPSVMSMKMILDYPSYTYKKDEILENTGNAIIPQGTNVTWVLDTKSTELVTFGQEDSTYHFTGTHNTFKFSKQFYASTEYMIKTSNLKLKEYEALGYKLDVIRDAHPEITVKMKRDSIDIETMYFYGQMNDDYGLTKLQMVYVPTDNVKDIQKIEIPIEKGNFDEFIEVFPNQLQLQEGISYEVYFEVFDNDAIHNFKKTKSDVFIYRKLSAEEKTSNQLKDQKEAIDGMNKSLEELKIQNKELKQFSKTQKEQRILNFSDKKKLDEVLKRQKEQDKMMQNFNKKLKQNLEKLEKTNEKDKFKEQLEKRLEQQHEQLKKDEELLKELEKLAKKMPKEELAKKLENLSKQNKNKKRSLEQLLELTKRYFVSKKMEQVKDQLDAMAKEQEELSDAKEEENTKSKQEELNKDFKELQKELDDIRKENESLNEPIELPKTKDLEKEVIYEQEKATEKLGEKEKTDTPEDAKTQTKKAKKNQKKAAQKMKEMGQGMMKMMKMGGRNQMTEDIDMLRQILDNLLVFSFEQEELMLRFKQIEVNHNLYAKSLRKQQSLRTHFEHVDDSLFALSLRQPRISEHINKEINDVYFYVDKAMVEFSENKINQGVAAQQYITTSTNNLANFLSNTLENMEREMEPSQGQGEGKGKGESQLPDIIMGQKALNEKMQQGMDKKEGKSKGEEEGGQEGEKNKGDKDGTKSGEGNGQNKGEGENQSEEHHGELFEIYQRQQQLREQLQNRLAKEGLKGNASVLVKKMEDVEQDLLNSGFTNQTLQKMMELQHQLLKLENATFQQGEEQKRKSITNTAKYRNSNVSKIKQGKEYFNTTEILNRQALPLHQNYKKKVQAYFKDKDD